MIGSDRIRDGLQQHRLSCSRRRHDQATLSLADRSEQVQNSSREILLCSLELQPLVRIQRREVIEKDLIASLIRVLEVDGFDFDQGEVAFSIFRRTHLTRDRITRAQVELANL